MNHTRPLLSRSLRSFAIGFALASCAVAGVGHLSAQAIGAHNSRAPVNFDADNLDLLDRQNRLILSGSVVIRQADLTLRTARAVVDYTDAGSLDIQRLTATGGVTVNRGGETVSGDVGVYDFNRRIITLSGNVRVARGSDRLRGGRLVIDLNSGVSSVNGSASGSTQSSGGRVSGSFNVPGN